MNENEKALVSRVEESIKNYQPCTECGMYGGTHQAGCEYLRLKGLVDSEETYDPGDSNPDLMINVEKGLELPQNPFKGDDTEAPE